MASLTGLSLAESKRKGIKRGWERKERRQEGIDTELGEEPEPASSRLMYERGFI